MALSFPLSPSVFFDRLRIVSYSMTLPAIMETNETEGGEILQVEHGPQLWTGSVTCNIKHFEDGTEAEALFETLLRSDASFFAYDFLNQWPRRDTDGAIAKTISAKVSPVSGNSRAVRVSNIGAGYDFRRGDLLSFAYGTKPTRYALHRVTSAATSATNGVIASLEVHPPIRPGLSADTVLNLYQASCKAKLTAYSPPTKALHPRSEINFSWRQTLR